MTHITKEEILKLAKASNIDVSDKEMPELIKRLEGVLSYASCLKDVAQQCESVELPKQTNVMRDDVVKEATVEPLLELAPEREENYYVVPVIIKQ